MTLSFAHAPHTCTEVCTDAVLHAPFLSASHHKFYISFENWWFWLVNLPRTLFSSTYTGSSDNWFEKSNWFSFFVSNFWQGFYVRVWSSNFSFQHIHKRFFKQFHFLVADEYHCMLDSSGLFCRLPISFPRLKSV